MAGIIWYHLVSIGNGEAYSLTHNGSAGELFVQGDDATQFREEWDALETAYPDKLTWYLLREMRDRYSDVLQ